MPRAVGATVARLCAPLGSTPPLILVALGIFAGDLSAGAAIEGLHTPVLIASAAIGGALALWSGPAGRRAGMLLVAIVCGYTAAAGVYRPILPADHIAHAVTRRKIEIEAVVAAEPEARSQGSRLWLNALRVHDAGGWRAAHGPLLLTVRQLAAAWEPGEIIRTRVRLRQPRNFGNPGEFDYEGYLARRGIYVTAYADTDTGFERVAGVGKSALLLRWRRGVAQVIRHSLPEPQAGVLQALILGTAAALQPDLREAFGRAGVSHVLSISGLHVGLVAASAYVLLRWLLARSRWLLLAGNVPKLAAALSVVPVFLYAGIAGSNIATVRSVLMVLVFLAAVLIDRQRHILVSLAVAAIVILLWAPGTARDISFQLSFVSVIGLVYGMERFWPWWRRREEARLVRLRGWRARLWRPIATSVAVSLSALAATAPLTALHFNQVSLIAPLANAIVVPLLGSAAVTLGLLAALAYPIAAPVAVLCTVLAGPILGAGIWAVRCLAAVPGAALHVVTPTLPEVALMYGVLLAALRLAGRPRRVCLAVLAVLASTDAAWWAAERYHRSDLRITFLSVGQGDSAVVELPGNEVMVIDGGGLPSAHFDVGERVIAPFLWSRKIATVDYLVLSHPQWDHYGGFAFLVAHFAPRQFWSGGGSAASPRFARLQRLLDASGTRRVTLHRGDTPHLGHVQAAVHSPPADVEGLTPNDQSLVLSLGFAGARVLFCGDIEAPIERTLATTEAGALASAILKVPHHGSRTSSTARFLDAVAPTIAVASVGFENGFGFPHPDVVRRYTSRAVHLARTDRDGAVEVRVAPDGTIMVRTFRKRSEIARFAPPTHPRNADNTVDSLATEG